MQLVVEHAIKEPVGKQLRADKEPIRAILLLIPKSATPVRFCGISPKVLAMEISTTVQLQRDQLKYALGSL